MHYWFKENYTTANLNGKFKLLLNPAYVQERELLEQWIQDYRPSDGDLKAKNEFQQSFHSIYFELYLNQLFLKQNALIDTTRHAPDFFITEQGSTYAVEATVANIAQRDRQEENRTEADIYGSNDYYEITDASIVRILRRIRAKSDDFIRRYDDETREMPFVIAIADYSGVNYGQAAYFSPLAVLYNAYYDPADKLDLKIICEDASGREYKHNTLYRRKNRGGRLGVFSSPRYSHISAVAYTSMLSLGKLSSISITHGNTEKYICVERESFRILRQSGQSPDETLGDGLFIFHNPYASKPLSETAMGFPGTVHVRHDDENSEILFSNDIGNLLVRRYVGPLSMAPIQLPFFHELAFVPIKRSALL